MTSTNNGRIMKEIKELRDNPDKNFTVSISETNLMDWYIKYHNLDDKRFTDGEYILHIKLHEGYPFKAPDFRWLTPNGRFEVNQKICYNISTYHEGEWNPLWRMRTIIIGILSNSICCFLVIFLFFFTILLFLVVLFLKILFLIVLCNLISLT